MDGSLGFGAFPRSKVCGRKEDEADQRDDDAHGDADIGDVKNGEIDERRSDEIGHNAMGDAVDGVTHRSAAHKRQANDLPRRDERSPQEVD